MRMPGMDGVKFLSAAREIAPDMVRIMLTGNADQQTAIDAVNHGEIFRFLNKPTDAGALKKVVELAIRQHELVRAEKELLEKTLKGSVALLSEMLAIVKPEIFGRTDRIGSKAKEVAAHFPEISKWEFETATSLALLGCVGLSPALMDKTAQGVQLSETEQLEYAAHPLLAAHLLRNVPRMESVAEIVLYQHKQFDGGGFPTDERRGRDLPLGARILHVVTTYDGYRARGWSDASIFEHMRQLSGRFDPRVLEIFGKCLEESSKEPVVRIPVPNILEGMRIEEDVRTTTGILLVCQGQTVTSSVKRHLEKFTEAGLLVDPVLVTERP
jgi:response regulator RpfG family c-di-GMP phosphodiesterase